MLLSASMTLAQANPQRGRFGEQQQQQQPQQTEGQQRRLPPPEEKNSVTHHSARIGGQQINYTATAATYVVAAGDVEEAVGGVELKVARPPRGFDVLDQRIVVGGVEDEDVVGLLVGDEDIAGTGRGRRARPGDERREAEAEGRGAKRPAPVSKLHH